MNVLVVDHEFNSRQAALAGFTELGATVIAVDSGDRALQILRAEPAIVLMFIRVELPVMGGTLVAALARRVRSRLSIVLTTSQPTVSVPPMYRLVPMPWSKAALAELLSETPVPAMAEPDACLQ